ncbi:MAG TPA: nitroreductase family protein [Albitalea sp.]|nr:nitroreductase family protein [Albitalea sp.]
MQSRAADLRARPFRHADWSGDYVSCRWLGRIPHDRACRRLQAGWHSTWTRGGGPIFMVSMGAAIQNMLLGAHALGFGGGLTSGRAMSSPRLRQLIVIVLGGESKIRRMCMRPDE